MQYDFGSTTLAIPTYAPDFDWFTLEPAKTIEWTSCYSGQKCARLLLPLDYEVPDGPTTAIALRMIPAADKENYRGTILVNPGGPGGSGTGFIERAGTNISRIVGDSFDLLGFDPRGIGASTPSADCFESDSQRRLWGLQDDYRVLNLTDGSLEVYRAREKLVAARCEEKIGGEWGIARHAGTDNVARDMLEIVQQLGQEKLQYWGFSYGTVLGQYFASLFPDKVGRLVIDGVFDAYSYAANIWDTSMVDTQVVVDAIFDFCHAAGPEKCPLWESTAAKVKERYLNVLRSVEVEPVPIPLTDPPIILTKKHLVVQLFHAGYKPLALSSLLADTIRAIETHNDTALATLGPRIVNPTTCDCATGPPQPSDVRNEAFAAIECADGDETPFNSTAFAAFFNAIVQRAPDVAPLWAGSYLQCAEWRVRPRRRYTGPFAADRTAHPLLVLSPRFDPVCPLADARAVHARFGGAGLLVQESYGHCSLAAPSLCTAKHVREYFVNGTLPEPGTVCEVDELPFVGKVPVGGSAVRALSVEDAELLDALKGLSAEVPMFRFR
ncbi:alpha/beta-hydrolase [Trametes maxima]|nr:alpha/beta-hydrolase [Trametes maxima]